MHSDRPRTPESFDPPGEAEDPRRPIFFNMPPFPSTVIRPPDPWGARPCSACGELDCASEEHRLVDYRFGHDPGDPVVLIVEDCFEQIVLWRSETPSTFLKFAAGTHARRSEAEAAGAVYAPLAPPLETK